MRLPSIPKPMLATAIDAPFSQAGWVFEPKYDGYRMIATTGPEAELFSRNNNTYSHSFVAVAEALESLPPDIIFDGELVVLDEAGKISFSYLQNYQKQQRGTPSYYIFDLLTYDGIPLTPLPWNKRRKTLEAIFPDSTPLQLTPYIEIDGISGYEKALSEGHEGIVGKRKDSRYEAGVRSSAWVKVKRWRTQEAVVGGFTTARGNDFDLGALLLGVYDGTELRYIGHVGTGMTDEIRRKIKNYLTQRIVDTSPFVRAFKTNETPVWVKPEIVVEVEYLSWTQDHLLRQSKFRRIRNDRVASNVRFEQSLPPLDIIARAKVPARTLFLPLPQTTLRITHPHKVFFPGLGCTKADVLDYYQRISPLLLPHLKNRPQVLHRFPHGIEGESFYHKNVENAPDFVSTHKVYSESNNEYINYLMINNLETLLYVVQLGCIDLNPWHSRVPRVEFPDYAIFDLDPVDISFSAVVEVALALKEIGDIAHIPLYAKTSGGRGMHIAIPLAGAYHVDQVLLFLQILAKLIQKKLPSITSRERSPANRKGKVYLDIGQNNFGQTIASVFSVRPRPGAPISTPLKWDEVRESLDPQEFTIESIEDRLHETGDLWKGMNTQPLDLLTVMPKIRELV